MEVGRIVFNSLLFRSRLEPECRLNPDWAFHPRTAADQGIFFSEPPVPALEFERPGAFRSAFQIRFLYIAPTTTLFIATTSPLPYAG